MIIESLAKTADIVGIVGVVFLLLAYFLVSTNRISSQDLKYQLLNFTGACLILYSLLFTFNLASVVIETCWIAISLIGMYKILKTPKSDGVECNSNIVKLKSYKNKKLRR